MIAYLDASVLLRIVLDQPDPLEEWASLEVGVCSRLLLVECDRTLDRYWQQGDFDDATFVAKRAETHEIIRRLDMVPIEESILNAAAQPLPVVLGTLDALHLASASWYRRRRRNDERPMVFATHDHALARAAEAMRFEVIGV